jgi:mannose-1-phosphate guanylyltransferase/phosphomannomutase
MPRLYNSHPSTRVLVIAGGLGIRSANPKLPKVLQEISPGKTLLEYHLEELQKNNYSHVTFLLSKFADQVINHIISVSSSFKSMEIDWLMDSSLGGNLGALLNAHSVLSETTYLIILGDVAFSANLESHQQLWEQSGLLCGAVVHPSLHPEDSDKLISGTSNRGIEVLRRHSDISHIHEPFRTLAGIFFMQGLALSTTKLKSGDISGDLVSDLTLKGEVLAINSSYFYQDTGTPERLNRSQYLRLSGATARRGGLNRPAIFIDRDNTLIKDAGTSRIELEFDEVSPIDAQAIAKANSLGVCVFMITNQPGVAKGQITIQDVMHTQRKLEDILLSYDAFIDDIRFCPHHPERDYMGEIPIYKVRCSCRKPGGWMVQDISTLHQIDLKRSFMLGDSTADMQLAANLGMEYVGCSKDESQDFSLAEAIDFCLRKLLL